VNLRSVLTALGVGVVGVALAVLLVPGASDLVPVDVAVTALGNDYVLVATLGLAALAGVVSVVGARGVGGLDQATPPDPERVYAAPRMGAAFDEFVSRTGPRAWLGRDADDDLRERLRRAAVAVVMREQNCARAEAERRVASGDWTRDPTAAAFLRERDGSLPVVSRLRVAIRGRSWTRREARLTALEIARIAGVEDA